MAIFIGVMLTLSLGFARRGGSRSGFLGRAISSSSKNLDSASSAPRGSSSTSGLFAAKGSVNIDIVASHPAYNVLENGAIDEYGVQAILYEHKKSGAQVMSVIAPEDNNKVFGITLRTPPKDSTGVPHILEHSVLCGSRDFPVKEPFVDLLKGSLQNFLNAFTYPDRTCYPVASTNTKDFYNLASVYLDAVLHPRAVSDPLVLQQEGWHLELDKKDDPLTYKGVVYNEMKGVYSSPDSLLARSTQQALFPDNTYGVDSGGDPLAIPDLSFSDFKAFHSEFYHPSNSRVFFYGDDDPLKRLSFLDERLSEFDKIPVTSQIQYQKKTLKPARREISYPVSADTPPKHYLTVNWLLNDEPLPAQEMLALGVLDSLLLGQSSSKLRKILTESQLGDSVTGGGLSDELLQATFSVGLKGVKPEDVQRVEALVLTTFDDIAKEGFDQSAIDAAMNTLEFRLREYNTGGYPKGLSFMLSMMSQWIYDKNALDGVRFEDALAGLKADLAAGKPVFQDLIRKYIVANEHRVTVEMRPDEALEAAQVKEEEERLASIKAGLSSEQLDEVIQQTFALKEAQAREDSAEAKSSLPRLGIEDIERAASDIPIAVVREGSSGGETILTHELTTSGILYADIGFDFSSIDPADAELLPLFTRLMMEAGTDEMDVTALQRKIGAETGGISASLYSDVKFSGGVVSRAGPEDSLLYFMMRGKATAEKVPVMLDLMKNILLSSKLDNKKRAVEMLKESKIGKETSVITSGHSYASSRLASRHSFLGYLGEVTGGLTSVRNAGPLLDAAENDWETIQARLHRMRDAIVTRNGMIVNLTGDDKVLGETMPAVEQFLDNVPMVDDAAAQPHLTQSWSPAKLNPIKNEGFYVPSQVNYVVKGGQMYQPGEAVSGATSVITRYLSLNYLWDTVRVMGGAYGGFGRFSETSGRFVYMSYRDPNLKGTLDAYDKAPTAIAESDITAEDILQGVIGAVGDLDGPMSPDQKGYASMVRYMTGESLGDRQKWRDEVLGTTKADFVSFAEKLNNVSKTGSVAVVGSQAALEEANKQIVDAKDKIDIEAAY